MVVFSRDAEDALAGLDPREAARLDLVFPDRAGERLESSLFEIGDFAAGRAFLAAGRTRR
jgi:uracil-DNA glycosylase